MRLYPFLQRNFAVMCVIVVTCFVSWLGWQYNDLFELLIYDYNKIHYQDHWHRLITYGLLHEDRAHLLDNMVVLGLCCFSFTKQLKQNNYTFGLFYITSLLFAGYAMQVCADYQRSLGASGAVCAVVAATVLLNPFNLKSGVAILLVILYFEYKGMYNNDDIGHIAHIAGYLFGAVFALFKKSTARKFDDDWH